jgi:hypothetical protein
MVSPLLLADWDRVLRQLLDISDDLAAVPVLFSGLCIADEF